MIVASPIILPGVAGALSSSVRGVDPRLLLELPFAAMLLAVAAIDLEHRIVPNRILAPAAVLAVVALILIAPDDLVEHLAAGGIAFAVLLLVALVHPGGIGMGDVKLAAVMGLYLGVAVAPALTLAFLAGSLVGVAMMVRHGASARKRALPFAPFLALGGLVGLLVGPELVDLYVQRFL
jgi:leader peptidase (prepilin peptidase) / N-methyltransferase